MRTSLSYKTALFVLIVIFLSISQGYAQYTQVYQHFLDQARSAIRNNDYHNALIYLETAQSIDPSSSELTNYINIVKRALEKRLSGSEPFAQKPVEPQPSIERPSMISMPMESVNRSTSGVASVSSEPVVEPIVIEPRQAVAPVSAIRTAGIKILQNDIVLDEGAWSLQPNTLIDLSFDEEIIFKAEAIDRFLAITPDVIAVKRQSSREIAVSPLGLGRTFFHVWADGKLWTFNVKTMPRSELRERQRQQDLLAEGYVDSFRFLHDLYWSSFYQGPSFGDLDRQALNFRNKFSLFGPTPYGGVDASLTTYKTDTVATDITDYTIGLSGARWKSLKNIDVRLFDNNEYISSLTFPGRDFRGISLNADTIDDRFSFMVLRGEDQATFGSLSSGVSSTRESYFEAGTFSYSPREKEKISLNYAHAWGDDKSSSASDRVVSVEYKTTLDPWDFSSEIAYDESEYAQLFLADYRQADNRFFAKLRNVPRDYATIAGPSGYDGEVGAEFSYNHRWHGIDLTHYLDLYRDRETKKPENPKAINIDFNSGYRAALTDQDSLQGNIYFIKTPGTLADRMDFRFYNTYAHQFEFFSLKNAQLSFTTSYQRSRSDPTPSSDYDRIGLGANFSLPLNSNWYYQAGYEFSYIDDVGNDEKAYPAVFNTGLSYSKTHSNYWRTNFSAYYRDEENTDATKSFLAGQDSLTLTGNVTYSPTSDVDIYLDGRVRDVWAENDRTTALIEADIRMGMRSEWDLGVRWNPVAIIQGFVYKDINMNGLKDKEDPGIPGVRVNVGEGEAVTDQEGWYFAKIKAKSALVSVDVNTIPHGFVFQDITAQKFEIAHGQYYQGDFALTTESGIHGVVYHDENHNGRPDNGDAFISDVRISLEGDAETFTDSKGAYFFNAIPEGRYVLSIDIRSFPASYLPQVPLKNTIDLHEGSTYIFHIPVKIKNSGK